MAGPSTLPTFADVRATPMIRLPVRCGLITVPAAECLNAQARPVGGFTCIPPDRVVPKTGSTQGPWVSFTPFGETSATLWIMTVSCCGFEGIHAQIECLVRRYGDAHCYMVPAAPERPDTAAAEQALRDAAAASSVPSTSATCLM